MKTKSILFCLLFALCANSFTAAKAQININDSLALVDLYNSTNGPNWINHTNWLTTKPVSTWYGITVITHNRVTYINLPYNALAGSIPSSFGNIDSLIGFDFEGNQLSGSIPSSIGNLVHLTEIILFRNQLSGTIPSTIGNLVNLENLDLGSNQLTGTIPSSIGNLVNVGNLSFDQNELSGTIPAEIGNLVNVRYLLLSSNQLTGTIPSSFGNLANILFLALDYNQLSGSLPSSIGNLAKLNYFTLSNNQLTGTVPASFNKLTSLSTIDFSYNQLSKFGDASSFTNTRHPHLFGKINNNLFTFNGLQYIAKHYRYVGYAPQDTMLPIHKNGNMLSVSAGGTLSNNTYKWFKVGATDSTTIKGDSTFTPTASGKYYAKVANAIATQLTLYTDTISYTMSLTQTQNSIANVAAVKTLNNHFSIYPNPAKDIVHVQVNGNATITLTNSAGKILFSKSINTDSEINVSSYANGVYYIQNKTTGETQKVIVAH